MLAERGLGWNGFPSIAVVAEALPRIGALRAANPAFGEAWDYLFPDDGTFVRAARDLIARRTQNGIEIPDRPEVRNLPAPTGIAPDDALQPGEVYVDDFPEELPE